MPSIILSDNGVSSGSAGLKTTAASDGSLALQTTTAGGTATTAVTIDTSQRAAFVAGTAALPAITTSGDTNTGIFFPAADTIAFAEGGTEAMRIDSSGNMGLGVTPSAWYNSANSKALQIPSGALSSTGLNELDLTQNGYLNAGATSFVRVNAGYASQYVQTSGQHQWFNAASSTAGSNITFTQAMTLDASGNLLVGTTGITGGLNGNVINLFGSGTVRNIVQTTGQYSVINMGSGGTSTSPSTTGYLLTDSSANTFGIYTGSSTPLLLGTAGAERARIDSSGNLLVGTTSAVFGGGQKFVVQSNSATVSVPAAFSDLRTGSAGSGMIYFIRNTSFVGQISTTDVATIYSTSSDYRLKENIAPMTGALETVSQLKPCTYEWKLNGFAGQGFIAHELQSVIPDAVIGEKDAVDADGNPKYQGIDTSFLVATLTAAIQELNAKFEAYKATHP